MESQGRRAMRQAARNAEPKILRERRGFAVAALRSTWRGKPPLDREKSDGRIGSTLNVNVDVTPVAARAAGCGGGRAARPSAAEGGGVVV